MKRTITNISLSLIALSSFAIAQAAPCNTDNHICFAKGDSTSNIPDTNKKQINQMYHMLNNPHYGKVVKHKKSSIAAYIGVMGGVDFARASGTSLLYLNGPTGPVNTFSTKTSKALVQYGAFAGLSFAGLNNFSRFHPELSFWGTTTMTAHGVDSYIPFATVVSNNYSYQVNVKAIGLNGLFDFVKWNDLRIFAGGGVNLAQITASHLTEDSDVQLSAATQKTTRAIYDLKVGLGLHFLSHVQTNLTYTYYPSFNYSTGKLKDKWAQHDGAISDSMHMQMITASIAYTF